MNDDPVPMSMMWSQRLFLVLPFLLVTNWEVEAGDIKDCEGNNLARKMPSCSRLIDSGKLKGSALASAHNNRGVGLIRSGRKKSAIADFDAALSIDPEHYKARMNRGSAYVENGQLEKALIDYDRVIELKPDFAGAYDKRALTHFFRGEPKRALIDFNKAIELTPDAALVYNNRGVVHESMGLVDNAIADYRKALELDPSLAIAKTNLHSLLGDAVSAGLGQSRSTHSAGHSILVPLSTSDSVRYGLQTKPRY